MLEDFEGTLLSDGADAYAQFARERPALVHAQCWSHTRRMFLKAQALEPDAVAEALAHLGALYAVEEHIRKAEHDADQTLVYRAEHALPAVHAFFIWATGQCRRMDLTPSIPLAKAIDYARERKGALRVCLGDPAVFIDTNHLERALRPIPMGSKSWLFYRTVVGDEHVGVIQSLITTCRLHGINPYTYLVDVLKRIPVHPDSAIEDLTPRRWTMLFASAPLPSYFELATR